jgi:hypothetical protein
MSLPIDPSLIPPGVSLGEFEEQEQGGIISRGSFSVVGANITIQPYSLFGKQVSISDYSMITSASVNDLTTTVWQNFITGEEVTKRFYLANALNSISPFNVSVDVVELVFDTQINDPNYIDYVNNGINGVAKDLNDSFNQTILQTVGPPPSSFTGTWNGVTEEAYNVDLLNSAMEDYAATPSATTQAELNSAIATFDAYAASRNVLIASYNAQLAIYNTDVGAVNNSIQEFNDRYQNYAIIGPIDTFPTNIPEYEGLITGLPSSPTTIFIPVELTQFLVIEFPVSIDVYRISNSMNFLLHDPFANDPTFGTGTYDIQSALDTYNNTYVAEDNMQTFPSEIQLVNDLNNAISQFNGDGDEVAFTDAVNTYNTQLSSLTTPTINDLNTNIINTFNTQNTTLNLIESNPPNNPITVTISSSISELINDIIAVANAALVFVPDLQYTPFPTVSPGVVGIEGRGSMPPAPSPPYFQGNVDLVATRDTYPNIPDFTPPLLPDAQYSTSGSPSPLDLLQETPLPEVDSIPTISSPPDYSDPTDFNSINVFFDDLNTDIDTYNTTQVSNTTGLNETDTTTALNDAIAAWNAEQTQQNLDALNLAIDAYNIDIVTLNAGITSINNEVTAFNTAPAAPGAETLAGLNSEIETLNVSREAYDLTPMPLYDPKPPRDFMPPSPVNSGLTLANAPSSIVLLSSPRVDYPAVPLMTQDTINDNFIVTVAATVQVTLEDAVALTQIQFQDPAYLAYRDLLIPGGLNVLLNDTAKIYLEGDSGSWPSTTYFGVAPPIEPTNVNLSPEGQQLMSDWIAQVMAAMPYNLSTGTSPADLSTLQNAIDDYNTYITAVNANITTYNNSIDAVNEQIGINAYSQEPDDVSISFSQYGSIPPPAGIVNDVVVEELILSPPPPTFVQENETFIRTDDVGQQAVTVWLAQVLGSTVSQQDKDAAQLQHDEYFDFVDDDPDFEALPDTLNGYAQNYNERYVGVGLIGALAEIEPFDSIDTVSLLPSTTDPSVTGKSITDGTTTINNINAYSVFGFMYAQGQGALSGSDVTLDQLNGDIDNYNSSGRIAEKGLIDDLNDAIDDFNSSPGSNYFNALGDLQTATITYATGSDAPSTTVNSSISDFNETSLDIVNAAVSGFIPSINLALEGSGIGLSDVTILSPVDFTSNMPEVTENITSAPVPGTVDQASNVRPLKGGVYFTTSLSDRVDGGPELVPLFFTFDADSIEHPGQSDMEYIRDSFYNDLVGIPYQSGVVSGTIPEYNQPNSNGEGLLAENAAIDALNVAIDNFSDVNSIVYTNSNVLKNAVEAYVTDITNNPDVNQNIRDLNAKIDEWMTAYDDANERLDFWGIARIPEEYAVSDSDLMSPPPVPIPFSPTADYDINDPPDNLDERGEVDFPSVSEGLLDSNGDPVLDPPGTGEPVQIDIPVGLNAEDYILAAAGVQADEVIASAISGLQDLGKLLNAIEVLNEYRLDLSGKRKAFSPAIIPIARTLAFTGAVQPSVGYASAATGLSSPTFFRLLVSDVITASETRSVARNSSSFSGIIDININQLLGRVSFLATFRSVAELAGTLPSLVNTPFEDILDTVRGSLALNLIEELVSFVESNITPEINGNLFGRGTRSGRSFDVLGNDSAFVSALTNINILSQAIPRIAEILGPGQVRILLGDIPALRGLLGDRFGSLKDRIATIGDDVNLIPGGKGIRKLIETLKVFFQNSPFFTPQAATLTDTDLRVKAIGGKSPKVWSFSLEKEGFEVDKLPVQIFKQKALKQIGNASQVNVAVGIDETPKPKSSSDEVPELTPPQAADVTPGFDPTRGEILKNSIESGVLQDSIERSNLNSSILRSQIIDNGIRNAANLDAISKSRIRDDIISDSIQDDALIDSLRDDAADVARLSKDISNDLALDQYLDSQRTTQNAVTYSLQQNAIENEIVTRGLIQKSDTQSRIENQREINDLVLQTNLRFTELQEDIIGEGVLTLDILRSLFQSSIESVFQVGSQISGRISGKAEFEEPYDYAAAQEKREGILRDHMKRSAMKRGKRQDKLKKLELHEELREDANDRDRLNTAIVKFKHHFDGNLNEIRKSVNDDNTRKLAIKFNDFIDDLLIVQPRRIARDDPTVRAAYHLAVAGDFTRSIDFFG